MYTITQYNELDKLLGGGWHYRVANTSGDFSFAVLETIRFYWMQPRSLLDFQVTSDRREDNLQFTPFYTEQPKVLVFKFVRKDRNKKGLISFIQSS